MELGKKLIGILMIGLAIYVYIAITSPTPDPPEPVYEPVQTQQVRNTGWSTEWKMKELEDRMDYMAEQQRRDMKCIESGSSFC